MNDLNRMIHSIKTLSHKKPNANGLIEARFTKNALKEITGYLEDLQEIHSIFEAKTKE